AIPWPGAVPKVHKAAQLFRGTISTSKVHRSAIVALLSYFKSHPSPNSPHDLLKHRCINFRHGSAGVYQWEFDKSKKSLSVAVNGPLIVDAVVCAAIDGVGLAFVSDERVTAQLESGELIRVSEDWYQPFPGFYLYFRSVDDRWGSRTMADPFGPLS